MRNSMSRLLLSAALGATLLIVRQGRCESPTLRPFANAPISNELTIFGTCADEHKQAISGATVRLFLVNRAEHVQRELERTQTDSKGGFRLLQKLKLADRKPRALLVVVAQKAGMATIEQVVKLADSKEQKLELTLWPAGALRGRVGDAQGRAVAGALVSAAPDYIQGVSGIRCAHSDASGHYEIADLRAVDCAKAKPQISPDGTACKVGGYGAAVTHADFAPRVFMYTKVPGTFNLVLSKPARLEGRIVLDESGTPAVGARISMRNADHGQGRAITDDQGRYVISNVCSGIYMLSAKVQGRPLLVRGDIQVREGTNKLDLRVGAGGTIHGRIIDVVTGKPPVFQKGETVQPSINIQTARRNVSIYCGRGELQPDGTFSIQSPVGRVGLGFYVSGDWRLLNTDKFLEEGIIVKPGRTTEVEVRVRLHRPEDDKPRLLSDEEKRVLAEQAATAAIEKLGGSVETTIIGGKPYVTSLSMTHHLSKYGDEEENQLITDEGLSYARKFSRLKQLTLKNGQATDRALAQIHGLATLQRVCIYDAQEVTDTGALHLASLSNLEFLHLENSRISDNALGYFRRLPNLKMLSLQGMRVSDKGLAQLGGMQQLKTLCLGLGDVQITDAGLEHLSGLSNLEDLDLQGAKITDAGLKHLHGLKNLKELMVTSEAVTDQGIANLRKALPKLHDPREEPIASREEIVY